jgi:hypothetical protein
MVLIFFYIDEEKLLRKNSSFEVLQITEYFYFSFVFTR